LLLAVAFIVIIERKLLGRLQLRTGPLYVGFIRILQTIVDRLKLLSKDVLWFRNAIVGLIFLISALLMYYLFNVDIVIILVFVGYCFLYGAIKSSNLYSLLGSYRSVVLMLSYDVVLLLLVLYVYGFIWAVLASFVFLMEAGRTPNDLVEGESELVSGFNTEYSGGIFVYFFLGEYLILMFFFLKLIGGLFLLFLCILVRGVLPRLKYNELISVCWRMLFFSVVLFWLW